MRGVGLVTLLSVGAISAAPASRAPDPGPVATIHATSAFVRCFSDERRRNAVAQVSPTPTYLITIRNGGPQHDIVLHGVESNSPQVKAAEQC